MNLFKWNESYSVGVVEIDEQHQHLVFLINQFGEKLGKNTREDIGVMLNEMIDYTMYHFKTEEKKYLHAHPDFSQHQKEHQVFIDRTIDLHRSFVAEDERPLDIFNFLVLWLKNHILKVDKDFFADLHNS